MGEQKGGAVYRDKVLTVDEVLLDCGRHLVNGQAHLGGRDQSFGKAALAPVPLLKIGIQRALGLGERVRRRFAQDPRRVRVRPRVCPRVRPRVRPRARGAAGKERGARLEDPPARCATAPPAARERRPWFGASGRTLNAAEPVRPAAQPGEQQRRAEGAPTEMHFLFAQRLFFFFFPSPDFFFFFTISRRK